MRTIILNGRQKAMVQESQNVESFCSCLDSYKPDPAWNYQDSHGHVHRWDLALKTVPTIKHIVDEVIGHCDDGDYWESYVSHEECTICGDRVEPGYKIDVPAFMPVLCPTLKSISGSYETAPGDDLPELGAKCEFIMNEMKFIAYIIERRAHSDGTIDISFEG